MIIIIRRRKLKRLERSRAWWNPGFLVKIFYGRSPSYNFEWMYRSWRCSRMAGWRKNYSSDKDSKKGTEVGNYRPIACLNLIWKLLTGFISDKTYEHLQENKLLPEEQNGSRRKCEGRKISLREIDAYCKIAGKERQI